MNCDNSHSWLLIAPHVCRILLTRNDGGIVRRVCTGWYPWFGYSLKAHYSLIIWRCLVYLLGGSETWNEWSPWDIVSRPAGLPVFDWWLSFVCVCTNNMGFRWVSACLALTPCHKNRKRRKERGEREWENERASWSTIVGDKSFLFIYLLESINDRVFWLL